MAHEPLPGLSVSKPAVFMFLIVSVGLAASAIAVGIAEREGRVYDLTAVQDEIDNMISKTDNQLDEQEDAVCDLIEDVATDLQKVCTLTSYNDHIAFERINGDPTDCTDPSPN